MGKPGTTVGADATDKSTVRILIVAGQATPPTRSMQPRRSGIHDPGHRAFGGKIRGGGYPGCLQFAMAHRTRVQAPEIAAAHRYAAHPDRTRIAKLAARPSHPRLVMRRPQPGFPGISPPEDLFDAACLPSL